MRKIIAIFVAFLLFLTLLTACGTSGESAALTDLDELFVESNFSEDDMFGIKLKYAICAATLYGDTKAENNFGYVPGTTFSDLALTREKEVEAKYNCKIEPFYAVQGANIDMFNSMVLAGQYYCDMIQSSSEFLMDSGTEGTLIAIDKELADYIDWQNSSKWGSWNLLESICYNGGLLGVCPAAWPELIYTIVSYPIVFNGKAVRNAIGIDLREYMEKGTWVWNTFHQTLESLTYEDGGTTVYGMTVHPPYLSEMTLRSNGSTLYVSDGEGGIKCGYYTAEGRKAIEEVHALYKGIYSDCFYKNGDSSPETIVQNFVDGMAMMTACDTEHIYGLNAKISMNMEDFGILKWPTGPDVPAGYVSTVYEANRYTISFPYTADHLEEAATVINAMYEPFEEYPDRDSIKEVMKSYYFFDDRDAETFFEMFDALRANYNHFKGRAFAERAITNSWATTEELIATMESKVQEYLDDKIGNFAASTAAVFGNANF